MSVLSMLARVIKTTARGEELELHAYCRTHATDIAFSLGLPSTFDFLEMLDEQILAALPARLTAAMKVERENSRAGRSAKMQAAADRLGASLEWDGGTAYVDIVPFLKEITAGATALAFPWYGIAVDLDTLRRFAVPSRKLGKLVAYVDGGGLHIRWRDGRGGLNVRHGITAWPASETITCNFTATEKEVAA